MPYRTCRRLRCSPFPSAPRSGSEPPRRDTAAHGALRRSRQARSLAILHQAGPAGAPVVHAGASAPERELQDHGFRPGASRASEGVRPQPAGLAATYHLSHRPEETPSRTELGPPSRATTTAAEECRWPPTDAITSRPQSTSGQEGVPPNKMECCGRPGLDYRRTRTTSRVPGERGWCPT